MNSLIRNPLQRGFRAVVRPKDVRRAGVALLGAIVPALGSSPAARHDERDACESESMLLPLLAHEMSSPLAVLKVLADQVSVGRAPDPHLGAAAQSAAEEIRVLLERCVDAARVGAAGALHRGVQDLVALVGAAGPFREHRARFELSLPRRGDLKVETDAFAATTILRNLLENALVHGHADAPVHVRLAHEARRGRRGVAVEVENTIGPAGVPDPCQLFKRFYRSGKTIARGTGLGLHVSRLLAEQIGADLQFVPTQGRILFRLWLPEPVLAVGRPCCPEAQGALAACCAAD